MNCPHCNATLANEHWTVQPVDLARRPDALWRDLTCWCELCQAAYQCPLLLDPDGRAIQIGTIRSYRNALDVGRVTALLPQKGAGIIYRTTRRRRRTP